MTKAEFISKIPDIIEHESWGYAELEFMTFPKGDHRVGVLYRHKDNTSSYGTIGNNWEELYNDLGGFLRQKGLLNN